MFVYCKDYHNRVRCFPDVGLHDGSIPRIRQGIETTSTSTTPNETELQDSVEMSLEPAIWFKVLILDSISIDCAKRKILWTTCSQCRLTGQDREWGFVYCAHVRQLFHTDGECYDYDADLDDTFDIATTLLNDNPDTSSLLRLLHCYILPMISLNSEDLKAAEQALKHQIHSIEVLDQRLNGQINQMTKMKEYLLQKAKEFTSFLKGKDDVAYKTNREFLKVLLSFLPKIEDENREELINCQDKVQDAKREIEKCDENAALHLDNARHQRDEAHKDLQEILTFRECITNLVLIERDDWYELKSPEEDYLTCQDELEDLKNEAQLTAEKKKRAVSVREALSDAIVDLRQGKETVGLDFSLLNGERATDVLKRSSVPNMWQSLSERIGVMANSESNPLGQLHIRFCNHVITLCKESMEEELLKTTSLDNFSATLQLKSSPGSSVSSMDQQTPSKKARKTTSQKTHDSDKNSELKEHNKNPLKEVTEQLSVEIQDHFKNVTNLIQREENNFDTMFERKIWRCYEPYFYERTMDDLVHLYERANVLDQCNLRKNLPSITLKELEINEEWILELLSHPLVLEDGGFVDVSSSLASAPHSLQSQENMQSTPTQSDYMQTVKLQTEHVQSDTIQTEHVQSTSMETEHVQCPNKQTEHEQTASLQCVETQPLDSVRVQERKNSSEHCILRTRKTTATMENSDCISTSSEEGVSSSSSTDWHTVPVCLTDISHFASIVERKADTLDRQKRGQRQISLHLPDDDETDFSKELLEKIQTSVAGDENGANDVVFTDDAVSQDKSENLCLRQQKNQKCVSDDILSNNSCIEEQNRNSNDNFEVFTIETDEDNDSLYSQETNSSSQDTTASPLESSEEVFWALPESEENSVGRTRPWTYTHNAQDSSIFSQPAHCLRQQNKSFVENFRQTFKCISNITSESSLMKKLQWMTKCLQQLNSTMAEIFNQKCADNPKFKAVTGDDLPTILILLLIHGTPEDIASLLPQLQLMYDLVAPFVENGCHGYSLTQFQVVYGFLLKKMKQGMKLHRVSYTTSV
ncbi:uncharacterized protein LOC144450473 [Glandiceps talaboti]